MKNYTFYNLFKNHFLLLFIAFLGIQIVQSQTTPEVLWAKRYGGQNGKSPGGMVTDNDGNIYMTGYFSQQIQFGNTTLTTQGATATFVVKTDPLGNVLWATRFDGTTTNAGRRITVDVHGNIYTTGGFSGTTTFGTFTLVAQSESDIFVVKQDPSGDVLWVTPFAGTQNSILPSSNSQAIVTDAQGNIYTAGNFGAESITFGNFTLTRPIGTTINAFIVKQDPSGNVLWAKNFGETNSASVWKIRIDNLGYLYIIGDFSGIVNFGNTTMTNLGGKRDLFLAKLETFGEILWAKQFEASWDNQVPSSDSYDITVDQTGNIYLTGGFYGTLEVGTTTLISSSPEVVTPFVIKTNNVGEPLWAKKFTCGARSYSTGITSDASDKVYIIGSFNKSIDFDGISFSSFGVNNPNYPDYPDAFILKMDDLGMVEWAVKYGALGIEHGIAIATDTTGNVVVLGTFQLSVNFGTTSLTSAGVRDIFLIKLSEELSIEENKIDNWSTYPNPTNDFISLNFSNYNDAKLSVEVFNVLGQKVKFFENINPLENLDLSELTSGIYLLKINYNGVSQTIKIKKQ